MGDVHPDGNPHVQLDPRNIATIAQAPVGAARADRSAQRRLLRAARSGLPGAAGNRRSRAGQAQAAPLKGVPVVVIHKDQTYLCRWLGLNQVAAIEPKPGVPPSAGYLAELVKTLSSRRRR